MERKCPWCGAQGQDFSFDTTHKGPLESGVFVWLAGALCCGNRIRNWNYGPWERDRS